MLASTVISFPLSIFYVCFDIIMATDWMKEFDKIYIPYADCYVYENQAKNKITDANEKFNKYYTKRVRQSEIK